MRELERQQREAEQNGEKLDDFSGERGRGREERAAAGTAHVSSMSQWVPYNCYVPAPLS